MTSEHNPYILHLHVCVCVHACMSVAVCMQVCVIQVAPLSFHE